MTQPLQPIHSLRNPKTGIEARDIVQCAIRIFQRLGVSRTRLEDVATEAGVSRPLLYKFFANRQALLDAAIIEKLHEHLLLQKANFPRDGSFADVIVEGALNALRLAKQDRVMLDLFEHSSVQHLPELLLNPDMAVHSIFMELWKPVFDTARGCGELRSDLGDDDMLEWLLSVNYVFGLREDVSENRIRELLTQFVVPAFVARI